MFGYKEAITIYVYKSLYNIQIIYPAATDLSQ